MRVLIVSHYILPHVGGVEHLVHLEAQALADSGNEVLIVASDGSGAGENPDYPPQVRIRRVSAWHGLEKHWRVPYPLFSPGLLGVLRDAVRWADLVHAHGCLFLATPVALLWAKQFGKPGLLTDHGGLQHFRSPSKRYLAQLGLHTLGRCSCRWASDLVAYNSRVQVELMRLAGKPVRFLPNPVRRDLFRPPSPIERQQARLQLGWNDGRPRLLFVGRLIPEKGVAHLLEIASPEWEIVFCGPGGEHWPQLHNHPHVRYLPARPQAELISLYHAADVLVLPSAVREGFPLVVQEALACGLAAVLGEDPGFEPYRDWPGLYLTSPEPAQLRLAVKRALADGSPTKHPDYRNALDRFCPTPQQWLAQLLAPHASTTRHHGRIAATVMA
jgi:D-inositol-3-phosphate glycosyltransferase